MEKTITIKIEKRDSDGEYNAYIPGETDAYGLGDSPVMALRSLMEEIDDDGVYAQHVNELVDSDAYSVEEEEEEEVE